MTNTQAFLDAVKQDIKDYIIANSTYVAAGTGTTTETTSDTTLEAENYRAARQEYTEGTSDVVVSLLMPSTSADDEDVTEVGVLNAASLGDLMMRKVFPAITWTSDIDIWIDIEEQIDVTQ